MMYSVREVLKDIAISLLIAAAIVFSYAGFGILFNKIVAPELVMNIGFGLVVLGIVYFVISRMIESENEYLAVSASILISIIGLLLLQTFLPLIRVGDIVMKIVWLAVSITLVLVGVIELLQYFGIVPKKVLGL